MHVHSLRKPVKPVASLQEIERENAKVVQTQRHLSSLTEVSVDAPNTLCLSFTAIELEKRQAPHLKSPFNAAVCRAFGVGFHAPQDN